MKCNWSVLFPGLTEFIDLENSTIICWVKLLKVWAEAKLKQVFFLCFFFSCTSFRSTRTCVMISYLCHLAIIIYLACLWMKRFFLIDALNGRSSLALHILANNLHNPSCNPVTELMRLNWWSRLMNKELYQNAGNGKPDAPLSLKYQQFSGWSPERYFKISLFP